MRVEWLGTSARVCDNFDFGAVWTWTSASTCRRVIFVFNWTWNDQLELWKFSLDLTLRNFLHIFQRHSSNYEGKHQSFTSILISSCSNPNAITNLNQLAIINERLKWWNLQNSAKLSRLSRWNFIALNRRLSYDPFLFFFFDYRLLAAFAEKTEVIEKVSGIEWN